MKKKQSIRILEENTTKFLDLAFHIVAMQDDAYLSGHPEWNELVKEAKATLLAENINVNS
jgi:hypothetical protein